MKWQNQSTFLNDTKKLLETQDHPILFILMMSIKCCHLFQILSLVLSLLFISSCVYHFKTIQTKKIVRKCQKAVVKVLFLGTIHDMKTSENRDTTIVGSGFIISKDGYILTAKHIVGSDKILVPSSERRLGFKGIRVITCDGRNFGAGFPSAYPSDLGLEIGILHFDKPDDLPYLSIAEVESLELGEEVVVLGHPETQLTVTQGIINNFSPTRETFRISASLSSGSSGSPILN